MKVVKFGGSSVADAKQLTKIKEIVQADTERKIVVVSAAGKRTKTDSKLTDLLYLCYAHVKYGQDCSKVFNEIIGRYEEIIKDLGIDLDLSDEFAELKTRLDNNNIDQDELVSRGEYFSAKITAKMLDFDFVDAIECIKFNYDKTWNQEATYKAIKNIKINKGIVVPGFYGQMPNGKICTFTRGGSDVTGSILAAGFDCDMYENWTDVSGILVADPSIVENPKSIPSLSFEELRLLSYYGAKVLHEGALLPIRQKNIPLNIKNTNDPENPGSIINNEPSEKRIHRHFITGITGKPGFTVIVITKHHTNGSIKMLSKVLNILEEFRIKVDYVHNGIDSVSVAVESEAVAENLYQVLGEMQKDICPDKVDVHENIALIAAVGAKMADQPGTSGRIFSSLGEQNINIKIINQGPDESTIIFGVDNSKYKDVVRTIYGIFVK